MVDDIVDVVRLKFMKNRDDNRSVCQCGEERHTPMRTVSSANGNLVSLADSAFLENDMEFLYFASYVFIL